MWLHCEDGSYLNTNQVELFTVEQVIKHLSDGTFDATDEFKVMARRNRGNMVRYATFASKDEADKHLYYLVRLLAREQWGEKVSYDDVA